MGEGEVKRCSVLNFTTTTLQGEQSHFHLLLTAGKDYHLINQHFNLL